MNIKDLQNLIVMLLREVFAPTRIILFGSYAWGNPDGDSDMDICVLVSSSKDSPLQRAIAAHKALGAMPFAKDILVQTDAEFERYSTIEGTLQHRIANEGQILYDHAS